MCVFVSHFWSLHCPSPPSLPSFLSFLSLGVCYFSPVIRHVDSSLSPSNTTKINFPVLSHAGGPQWGYTCTCISFTNTRTRKHPHRRVSSTHTHTGANTLAGDSPHHCCLMSYLLHLCNIHLSSLTGSFHSTFTPALSAHTVTLSCDLLLLPLNSFFFFFFRKTRMGYCACEWLPRWCVVLETGHQSCQPLICDQCQWGQRVMNC